MENPQDCQENYLRKKVSKYSTVKLPVENLRNNNDNINMGIVKFSLPIASDIMYLILKFHHNGLINIYNIPKFATAFIAHRYYLPYYYYTIYY